MTRRIRFSPFLAGGVFAGAVLLAGAPQARAVDVPFVAQPPITSTSTSVRSAAGADVDGDGDRDVVEGGSAILAWHENTAGNGSAWTTRTISTAAGFVLAVSAADVDGDGDVDVLSAADFSPGTVSWYENTAGDGSAWTPHAITTALAQPESVVAADMDGDGDTDVVSAAGFGFEVDWYENAIGDGSAWIPHTVSTEVAAPNSVAVADVDGDGDLDVVSIRDAYVADLTRLFWFENTAGNGSAWTTHTIVTGLASPLAVDAADVDGDGDVDVLAASFYGAVTWHENTLGDGSAWTTHSIGPGTNFVVAADVDGDGDLDAVSANPAVFWHENTAGDGSSWTTHTVSTAPNPYFAAATDLDADGDEDLVAAMFFAATVAWYRNETIHSSACFATPPPISTAADAALSVFSADVDGDGDLDVLSASSADNKVAWYENMAGNGSAWTTHTITTALDFADSVVAADVDGDGDMDALAASDYTSYELAWYENAAGDGSLWTTHTITTGADSAQTVVAVDLDGDGDMDALSASNFTYKVAWYENTVGDGSAWTTHTITTGFELPDSVVAADVDGDGDVDVLFNAGFIDTLGWYENSAGDGSLWTSHTITTGALGGESIFAADVDGDADMDALSASRFDDKVAWYENTAGNGSAWTTHTITTAANEARVVLAADVDGDGDMDALSTSSTSYAPYDHDQVAWYENTAGDGSAWTTHTITTATDGARSTFVADVDGDGEMDALLASRYDDTVAWYENQGGQFSLAASDIAPATATNSELVSLLRIDASHLGRAGDHDLELASLGLLFEETSGDPLSTAEANALVESLRVYRDTNGNGVFDPTTDGLVTSLPDLTLTAGVQTVTLTDGDPNVQVGFGTPRTYFVVAELTASATQQSPNQLRVTHLGLGPSASTAEDRDFDIPLRPACPANVASGIVQAVVPLPVVSATKTVSGRFHEGEPIAYAITIANAGPGTAADTPADELQDIAPPGVTVTGADDGGDPGTVSVAGNDVRWNGSIAPASAVTVTIQATIDAGTVGTLISNQGTVTYDSDANGTGDATVLTDDPVLPGAADPTSFTVTVPVKGDLVHGVARVLDLAASGAPDVDLFGFRQAPHSSYEVVVDGTTGDIGSAGTGPALDLVAADGTSVILSSTAAGAGPSRSLRFENLSAGPVLDRIVRVMSQGCTTSCTPEDRYRVRAWDTTLGLARFNNSATQITVLLVQNTAEQTVTGHVWLWNAAGGSAGTWSFALPPHGTLVLDTSAVAPGVGGSLTVSHDAPYGALAGKAVALEPATGFTFDTPLVPRNR